MPHLLTASLFVIPVIIAGVVHMVAVTKNFMNFLAVPVNRRLFGENKTVRGFIIMPLAAIPGSILMYSLLENSNITIELSRVNSVLFGLVTGFAYVLFELPNSFLKRRLNISPGGTSKKFKSLFIILDQIDSNIGICAAALFLFKAPMTTVAIMFLTGLVAAFSVKRILYILRLKKEAF